MCRMLAIVSRKPIDAKYLLDFRLLAEKGKVAPGRKPGHTDGWGLVTYIDNLPIYLGRQPTNAISDSQYENACETVMRNEIGGIIFCQLRKRSKGKINLHNTPPLITEGFCFMHNGTVHKLGNEQESDSMQLLRMIANEISNNHSVLESIRKTYGEVAKAFKYTSLTSVLTNGKSVYAIRCVSSLENEEYYDLMYAEQNDSIIVSQEKTWQLDWERIENGKVLVINPNLEMTMEKL